MTVRGDPRFVISNVFEHRKGYRRGEGEAAVGDKSVESTAAATTAAAATTVLRVDALPPTQN